MSAPRHRGFTLIELLVVISILALLVSISLPALARARQAGLNIQCMNQMRQLNLAQTMYADDNQSYFPPAKGAAVTAIESYDGFWPNNSLLPYVSDLPFSHAPYPDLPQANLFTCPVYRQAFQGVANHRFVRYTSRFNHTAVTYTLNRGLFAAPSYAVPLIRYTAVLKPSAKSYLLDGLWDNNTKLFNAATQYHLVSPVILNLHVGETNNALYFDGHVTNMSGDTLELESANLFSLQGYGGSS